MNKKISTLPMLRKLQVPTLRQLSQTDKNTPTKELDIPMNVEIRLATPLDVYDCINCVKDSQLWDTYFNDDSVDLTLRFINKKQVYIARDEHNKTVGFMGLIPEGCFGKFPYLAILSVHAKYRGLGIGKQLLEKFESIGFEDCNRTFILCSDFNLKGHNFYKKNGYIECGKIDNLFKEGVAEHLFVKYQECTDRN